MVVAAMEVLGMSDLDDEPNHDIIPPGVTGSSYAAVIESVAEVIISDFVDLDVTLETPRILIMFRSMLRMCCQWDYCTLSFKMLYVMVQGNECLLCGSFCF